MAVLGLLAEGRTNREIGEALGMTLDGAKWHVGEIISKLGVGSREEAAEWWRRSRRPAARVSRALGAVSLWRWVAGGAGAVALGVVAVAVVVAGRGDDDAPLAAATEEATATPTVAPTEEPLTAEEILHRSEEAMGKVVRVRVESARWGRREGDVPAGIEVYEFSRRQVRQLRKADFELTVCPVREIGVSPFTKRSLGARAIYPEGPLVAPGATAPEVFELLGIQTIDGEDAWVIRYAFSYPSIEGRIPVEDTEWIAKDDYRLLRREREAFDPFGFVGQLVEVFLGYDEPPSDECPATPIVTLDELRPLTTPRLKSPFE